MNSKPIPFTKITSKIPTSLIAFRNGNNKCDAPEKERMCCCCCFYAAFECLTGRNYHNKISVFIDKNFVLNIESVINF